QRPPRVLDIMKQLNALMSNARYLKLSQNLEARLILSKLATRPLMEQYLYLYVDTPLRKFANRTYAINKEYGNFKRDISSLFLKRARHTPDRIQQLIDRLTWHSWNFIRGMASFLIEVKNEVYEHFLRPSMQERLEVRRDEIIKEREKRLHAGREM